MKKLKMFEYIGNAKEINRIRQQLTFDELFELSEDLDSKMETIGRDVPWYDFEKYIFDKFGCGYYENNTVIAIALELLSLYN